MIEHPIYARVCKDKWELEKYTPKGCVRAIDNNQYPVEVIFKRWKPRRTDQQNRYLWGVVLAIMSQETGNEVNDLYEYFLGEFFGWDEYEVMGRKRLRPMERSSKQIKARFSEFLEFIISRAAGLGIVVPPPNHDLPASFSESK